VADRETPGEFLAAPDTTPASGAQRPRRLGVLGTLIWDRILDRDGRREPLEEWGGISYGLEALSVAVPPGWVIQPLLKVGSDMAERALAYLGSIPGVDPAPGVQVVPFPTTRVELRYQEQERRTERLQGGAPPWSWAELERLLPGLDALYVNFITGFEMELETALRVRESLGGPIYADLHSLFLGITGVGFRVPRELPGWGAWLRAFDAVQMNEAEFELLGRAWGDPWRLAADAVGPELKLIVVTLGSQGSAFVAAPEFAPDPLGWPASRGALGAGGPARSGRVPAPGALQAGDPTGCGDVWGATLLGRLLGGDDLEAAMVEANRFAARNVGHRGARGLHYHLRGLLGA
jgi:sugar/nucleoside kinase (ribokinase family)